MMAEGPVFDDDIWGNGRVSAEVSDSFLVSEFLIFEGGFEAGVLGFVEVVEGLDADEVFRGGVSFDDDECGIGFR